MGCPSGSRHRRSCWARPAATAGTRPGPTTGRTSAGPAAGWGWPPSPPGRAAAASLGDSVVLTASADGTIRVWYPDSPVPQVYRGHRGAVRCLAVTGPDSWVSGGDDGCLISWSLDAPGSPQQRWRGHDAPVT